MYFCFALITCCFLINASAGRNSIHDRHNRFGMMLRSAVEHADNSLRNISDLWQIDNFPVFLSSFWTSPTSYSQMSQKFRLKILSGLVSPDVSLVMRFYFLLFFDFIAFKYLLSFYFILIALLDLVSPRVTITISASPIRLLFKI